MNALNVNTLGTSGLTTLVHKADHEGTITIDPMTGQILTPTDERPEWAESYSLAQVAQRVQYYNGALGEKFNARMKLPEILAAEDLDWLCTRPLGEDAEGNPLSITNEDGSEDHFEAWEETADLEFRNAVVSQVLGFTQTEEDQLNAPGYDFGEVLAEQEIAQDMHRSEEELEELKKSQAQEFERADKAVGE